MSRFGASRVTRAAIVEGVLVASILLAFFVALRALMAVGGAG